MTRQIDRVTAATADVMRILPFAGPPAHMSLDRDAAEQLAEATLSDLRAARPKRRART